MTVRAEPAPRMLSPTRAKRLDIQDAERYRYVQVGRYRAVLFVLSAAVTASLSEQSASQSPSSVSRAV